MVSAAFLTRIKLTQQPSVILMRRLSRKGNYFSCLSQVTKNNDAWYQNDRSGGDSWWCLPSTVSAALVVLGATAIKTYVEKEDYWRNNRILLSKLISTELSPAQAEENEEEEVVDDTTDIINWSGTHRVNVSNKNYWEPESIEEVEQIVKDCQARGQTVRPIGSSLSPNGVAFNEDGMISMANLDKIVAIDTEKKTITVEAGIPVREVRNFSTIVCPPFAVV